MIVLACNLERLRSTRRSFLFLPWYGRNHSVAGGRGGQARQKVDLRMLSTVSMDGLRDTLR